MKQIWKYVIDPAAEIDMPWGAEILCIQAQNDVACMWALVDPTARTIKRKFSVYGTGQVIPEVPGKYLGTFQLHGGSLVFHVFEEGV